MSSKQTKKLNELELKLIWKNYQLVAKKNSVWTSYVNNTRKASLKRLFEDDNQALPCPFCYHPMLKAQYQGLQSDQIYSWDICHIDDNSSNFVLSNLWPAHPWCIQKPVTNYQ